MLTWNYIDDANDPCERFVWGSNWSFTLEDSDVEGAAMSCMEIVDRDDESDDDIDVMG